MVCPDGWLALGGDARLRRALSQEGGDGKAASWGTEGLLASIAALEVRADGDEQVLRLHHLGSILEPRQVCYSHA